MAHVKCSEEQSYLRFEVQSLKRFVGEALERCGLEPEDASIGAEILVDTDLQGIDSHGVAHLTSHGAYVKGLQEGLVNPRAQPRILQETVAAALLDGDRGFGPVVAYRAMELAIHKAQRTGIGMVAVTNSHHFGTAGFYASMALNRDIIGLVMTNTMPSVSPAQGSGRLLGTNAISVAAPTGGEFPFLLDIATSAVALGKLELARRRGSAIPRGWALDREGADTTEPNDYWKGGSLLPLGSFSELSGHKGYGLALVVEVLCGVLTGVGISSELDRNDPVVGHFFGAIRIDVFRPVDEFKRAMDAMIRKMQSTPPAKGFDRVLVPGQKEHETSWDRSRKGIPLHPQVVEDLRGLGAALNLQFPSPFEAEGQESLE